MTIQFNSINPNGETIFDNGLFPNHDEAQNLMNMSEKLSNYDGEILYEERSTEWEKTFKVNVESNEDYERFVSKVIYEIRVIKRDNKELESINSKRDDVINYYQKGRIERDYAIELLNELDEIRDTIVQNMPIEKFVVPSFEEWKSGKYNLDEKRVVRLAKHMRKVGFTDSLLDFYSTQIKEEKTMYITISGMPQVVMGMSTYAEIGTWDGYGGTSCQDVRHGEQYIDNLLSSLKDSKLFVAFLHENEDDTNDLEDTFRARVIMREIRLDGTDTKVLIPTQYYGNNTTKDMLHKGLVQLEQYGIFSTNVRGDYRHREELDVDCTVETESVFFGYIDVCEEIEVSVDCPACYGNGHIELENDNDCTNVCCPLCSGSGEYETTIVVEHVEEIEHVEYESEVLPYAEGYSHYGSYVMVRIDQDYIEEKANELLQNA